MAAPRAYSGLAVVFPRRDVQPTVSAPPARVATNRPSGAGADWLTAPCSGGGVDESSRCVMGAAEPRRLAALRRGRGDAHAGFPCICTGSPRIERRRLRRSVIIAPMHGEPMVGRRHQRQPTMFFAFHVTRLVHSSRHHPRRRRARPLVANPLVDSRCEDGGSGSARRASPLA